MNDATDLGLNRNRAPKERSLRGLREAAGLSQEDVAVALEVSRQAVAKWEAANDPGERWAEFARVVGVLEPYPSAPFPMEARRRFFEERNAMIRDGGARRHFDRVAENAKRGGP